MRKAGNVLAVSKVQTGSTTLGQDMAPAGPAEKNPHQPTRSTEGLLCH